MAYTKQTWQTGEVITAEKLNHMENGIGSCVMTVNATTENDVTTLDKTWQEIHDAIAAGKLVIIPIIGATNAEMEIITSAVSDTGFKIFIFGNTESAKYLADTADGYPSYSEDVG